MPHNAGREMRRPNVTVVGLVALTAVGCVDLTPPWANTAAGGVGLEVGGIGAGAGGNGQGSSFDGPGLGAGGGGADAPQIASGGAVPAGGAGQSDVASRGGASGTGGLSGSGGLGAGGTRDAPVGGLPDLAPAGGALAAGGSGGRDANPSSAPDLAPDRPADTPPPVEAGALQTGLVAYYPCDNLQGTSLPDATGNGFAGVLMTGAADGGVSTSGFSLVAGKVGKGLALSRSQSSYISLPPAIFAQVSELSVVTWIQVTTAQNWQRAFDVGVNANLAKNPPTGTVYMNFVPLNGSSKAAFAITTNGYSNEQTLVAPSFATNSWKHLAIVLSAGQAQLYVDGSLVVSSSALSLRPSDLGTINYAFIGRSAFSTDPYFDGVIDEFRVYRRALSSDEVAALYRWAGP